MLYYNKLNRWPMLGSAVSVTKSLKEAVADPM